MGQGVCALAGINHEHWKQLQPALSWGRSHMVNGSLEGGCCRISLVGRKCAAGQDVEALQALCLWIDAQCWQCCSAALADE